jgi:MFS family permease
MTTDASRHDDTRGFRLIFRTLRYRNFRLFFGGQLISLVGTWMQSVAVTWLIYRMTGSAFLLGVVGFASQMPTFLISPFAGVLADRYNRHRILVLTQIMAMVQALLLAALTLTGHIGAWSIVALSALLGLVNGFDIPTRQSFVLEMIENREDLPNAIALNSSMFNAARLVGPSIAGVLLAVIGEGMCFLVNGLSFIAVIAALLAMKLSPQKPSTHKGSVLQGLREGLRYATGFPPIKHILLLVAMVSGVGMPAFVLMPVFAKDILGGGPHTLGFLMGAIGVGALTGAILLASRKSIVGLVRWATIATAIFTSGLIALAFSNILWLSLVLLFAVGFGMMVQMASCNTILQTVTDDDKRGRVMSFYTMAFMGMMPLGSLAAGSLASEIGTPRTVLASGVVCAIGTIWFTMQVPALRAKIRPVYQKKGIIPEMSTGIQSAAQLTASPENG